MTIRRLATNRAKSRLGASMSTVTLSLMAWGCSGSDATTPVSGYGGVASTSGGMSSTYGGATSGVVSSAGQASRGGALSAGATSGVLGGATSSGGGTNLGGNVIYGGGTGAGGNGTSNGGNGSPSSGGSGRAGASSQGGAPNQGGATGVGGKSGTGGSSMGGGTGGKAGAGSGTGGAATGGKGGGGATTGGTTAKGGNGNGGTGTGGSTATFRNPLNTSHGSDPFMTYYEGYYYLAATTWGTTLTMKRGRTISELKNASTTVIWSDTTASRRGNMWAPEFYLLDNGAGQKRWYHYYTAGDGSDLGTQRSYVLESDGMDPMGPYHFKGQLLNYWAIDASILRVDGKLYLLFSAWQGATQNVWIIGMSNPWTVTGARTLLTQPTYAWEREGTDPVNEGPIALYHAGRIFVTYSASQCASPGYKLGLLELTASNPLAASSWTKSANPVFQFANGNYGTGHNGFFVSPDGSQYWLVYHAVPNSNGSCWTDRTTRIQPFTWNANGTPNFGAPLALGTDIRVPAGE